MKNKNKSKKKKILIVSSALVLVLAVTCIIVVPKIASAGSGGKTVTATQVRNGDLSNYITLSGTVESANAVNVYSSLNEKVETIFVKVGDKVEKGQLLAKLDTKNIELDIEQQKSSLESSQKNGEIQLSDNQRSYNSAASGLANGTNSSINNAASALRNAQTDLETKTKNYNEKLADYQRGTSTQLQTAESTLKTRQKDYDDKLAEYQSGTSTKIASSESTVISAKADLETKTKNYNDNLALFSVEGVSQDDLNKSKIELENAQQKYDIEVRTLNDAKAALKTDYEQAARDLETAQNNYNDAKKALTDDYETAKTELDKAKNALTDAEKSLTIANNNAKQELEKYESSVLSSEISLEYTSTAALTKLETQLAESEIKAPASGTVTAIFATEGVTASGVLFVIEDVNALKILTNIKEYDLPKIELGLSATISSDATGDEKFDGVLTFVAPTSQKDSTGASIAATDVSFESEVQVTSNETGLKIGTNTRVDLIYQEEKDVLYVPIESIKTDRDGKSYVYLLNSDAMPGRGMGMPGDGTAGGRPSGQDSQGMVQRPEGGTTGERPSGEGAQGMGGRPAEAGTDGAMVKKTVTAEDGAVVNEAENAEDAASASAMPEATPGAMQEKRTIVTNMADIKFTVKAVEVTLGLETDLYRAVSGEGLNANMLIVSDASFVSDGDEVTIGLSNSGFTGGQSGGMNAQFGMPMGGGPVGGATVIREFR